MSFDASLVSWEKCEPSRFAGSNLYREEAKSVAKRAKTIGEVEASTLGIPPGFTIATVLRLQNKKTGGIRDFFFVSNQFNADGEAVSWLYSSANGDTVILLEVFND